MPSGPTNFRTTQVKLYYKDVKVVVDKSFDLELIKEVKGIKQIEV